MDGLCGRRAETCDDNWRQRCLYTTLEADNCEVAEVEAKARANRGMSEIPTEDLLLAAYRVSDALPPRRTGPS